MPPSQTSPKRDAETPPSWAMSSPTDMANAAAAYARDGVTCVRGVLTPDDVAQMQDAIEACLGKPSQFGEAYGGKAGAGAFRGDKFMWTREPMFRALALESKLPELAATLMAAAKVNLLYDHLLVKEPGSEVPTKWHHDQNYWPVDGLQICSIWLAFDTVDASNGRVSFVRGSHLWKERFQAMDFTRMEAVEDQNYSALPDIEAHPERYDIIAWDLEPGDCVVFAGLTLHGGRGNDAIRRRRAVSVRYTGDDVRFAVKPKSILLPWDPRLQHGSILDSDLFPVAWPA